MSTIPKYSPDRSVTSSLIESEVKNLFMLLLQPRRPATLPVSSPVVMAGVYPKSGNVIGMMTAETGLMNSLWSSVVSRCLICMAVIVLSHFFLLTGRRFEMLSEKRMVALWNDN